MAELPTGWLCPRCRQINAPQIDVCPCSLLMMPPAAPTAPPSPAPPAAVTAAPSSLFRPSRTLLILAAGPGARCHDCLAPIEPLYALYLVYDTERHELIQTLCRACLDRRLKAVTDAGLSPSPVDSAG